MKRILLIVSAVILSVSCTEEETGMDVSVTGFVRLISTTGEYGAKEGVSVAIQGSNFSAETDDNGKYLFQGLQAATNYMFEFDKPGYGYKCTDQKSFIGNQKPGFIEPVFLYQQPDIGLENVIISRMSGYIRISGSITPVKSYGISAYFSDNNNVSWKDKDLYSRFTTYRSGADFYNSIDITYSTSHMTYLPGTDVYVALYFYNDNEEFNYWDPVEKKFRLTSEKKAAVLKFTF